MSNRIFQVPRIVLRSILPYSISRPSYCIEMSNNKTSHSFIKLIDGIPTEVLAFGNERDDSLVADSANLIYVMFPGNPGSVAFYDSYLSLIYEKSPENIACVAVGHANHSNMCTQWGKTYNLKAQVSHKLSFCKELLAANPSAQLVLSGHSVGAYMVIEVIRELPPERVKAGHLLFPTVEHIGSTANGKALGPVFRFAKSLAWLGTGLIACLPKGLQKSLVKAFVKDTSAEGVDAVLTLLHPQVTYNALYLAMHEMDEIKDFHFERYASFQQKLTFYFAKTDDWVLPSTPSTVEKLLPESKVMVGDEGHLHAFVMKPSSNISMASKAFTWISHMLENANNAEQATARAER